MSKEVLSPINLLVISFSVINYVVRVRVHARCVDAHFFVYPISDMSGRFDRLSDRRKVHGKLSDRHKGIASTGSATDAKVHGSVALRGMRGIFTWLTLAFEDRVSHMSAMLGCTRGTSSCLWFVKFYQAVNRSLYDPSHLHSVFTRGLAEKIRVVERD